MKKICPHCNKEIEYDKHQQFGGHITNCEKNPKRNEIIEKIKNTRKKNLYKTYKLKCAYCNNDYELELTEKQFNNKKYKKCCSRTCSSHYSRSFIKDTKKCKCVVCGKETDVKINTSLKNCKCENCKTDYSSNESIRFSKIKKNNYKQFKIENNLVICKYCNQENCDNKICKSWMKGRNKIFLKLGFNKEKIGTSDFIKEYERIVLLLKTEYNNKSLVEIGEKYNINFQTIHMIFKSLGIMRRNNSESGRLAIKNGRHTNSNINIYSYKSGYHMTWENNNVWLRSSYEKEYAEYLDNKKIKYEVEAFRIQYFDTNKHIERTAIPDFYLPETNEIIEIKSNWTYNEQNMIDKFKQYKKLGYNVKLILDKKERKIV